MTDEARGLGRRQQRVRPWAAIAILRCVLSSPAAATAVLSERARRQGLAEAAQTGPATETDTDVDDVYAPQVLNAPDDDTAGTLGYFAASTTCVGRWPSPCCGA